MLSARRQGEWAHRLVCPCLKINEKLSALHYSDFRAGVMGIKYGCGVRCRPDLGFGRRKGEVRGNQRKHEMRTSGLYVSGHFGEVLQHAVRSDGRYAGLGLQVPPLDLRGQNGSRSPRIIINARRSARRARIAAPAWGVRAFNSLAGRIVRRTPRSEKAATAPREIPDQLLCGGESGAHIYSRIAGNAS